MSTRTVPESMRRRRAERPLSVRELLILESLGEGGLLTMDIAVRLRSAPRDEVCRPVARTHLAGAISSDQAYLTLRRLEAKGYVEQTGPTAPWELAPRGRRAVRAA